MLVCECKYLFLRFLGSKRRKERENRSNGTKENILAKKKEKVCATKRTKRKEKERENLDENFLYLDGHNTCEGSVV